MAAEAMHTQIHREALETPQQPHVEDEVTININKRIQDCGDGRLKEDCCIYRVPNRLRCVKEEAYTPNVVSIGPFHYGNENLQDMEKHKPIMFKRFIQRAMSSLNDLVRLVRQFEPKVRASYSETIKLTKQELVEMTLMDASFIIELFIMMNGRCDEEEEDDAILSRPWLVSSIFLDLILPENQLPFFVIEEIFNKAFPHDGCSSLPSFLTLTCESLEFVIPQNSKPPLDVKIKHFTDLLRSFYLQGRMPPRNPCSPDAGITHFWSYKVNALQDAGIKLKASDNMYLLDLKFSGHDLEIPQIFVDRRTEILFHNMIALEQCYYPYASYISDYATVLDHLIDTYKDVELLLQKEIVKSALGDSNDVVRLFNTLSKNVFHSTFNSEYLDIGKRLNDYCQDPRHKMMATLRRDYFNTPWRSVASFAGIILLVLTVVQTIFSVLQVV